MSFIKIVNCLHPITIRNKRYDDFSELKIRAIANQYFEGGHYIRGYPDDYFISVPCGCCSLCLKKRRNEWVFRIRNEISQYSSNLVLFVTFTFEDKYLNDETFAPRKKVQQFLDSLRKQCGKSVRHFIIGEFGTKSTKRLHYHGILFGIPFDYVPFQRLWKLWKYGRFDVQKLKNPAGSAKYLAKYMLKYPSAKDRSLTRVMCSTGFGLNYLTQERIEYHRATDRHYGSFSGVKYPLSRYYTSRIWTVEDYYAYLLKSYYEPVDLYFAGFHYQTLEQFHNAFNSLLSIERVENSYFNSKFYGKF